MAMAWPDAFRIADHLEAMPASEVPPEVEAALLSLGFPALKEVRKHKVSFRATYFLNFQSGEGVVLQLLGSELGDKALFDLQRPISAGSIARASELAQEAGLRVPKVLATGEVDKWGPLHDVPFVVYELIKTATVEDEVVAPKQDLFSVIAALRETLGRRSLADVDTEPLPRFEDCFAFIAYLQELSEQIQASELVECCTKMTKTLRDSGLTSAAPVLVHQDLNDGNVLCSPDCNGTWQLDALIDWEGAVVVDARVAYEKGEPWQSLRTLAKVIKTRWMMAGMAGSLKLPRCCAEELVEDYEMLCSSLVESGWLPQVQPLSSLAKQV